MRSQGTFVEDRMPQNSTHGYEFGPYKFDPDQRVLTCAGEKVALTPKSKEILLLLATNAGQLVEKDVLLSQVWPDTFVEEANLTQNIFLLRQALGDERRPTPEYIETVSRRGYRFVASVKVSGITEASDTEALERDSAPPPTVAVRPFTNAAQDPNAEYLADGLTLTRLYIATKQYQLAQETIEDAIQTLESLGSDAVLAEALTTSGIVLNRLGDFTSAKKRFEAAYRVADRCGDREDARRALLSMLAKMKDRLDDVELLLILEKLGKIHSLVEPSPLAGRVEQAINEITSGFSG